MQDTGFAEIVTAVAYPVVMVKVACAGLAEIGRAVNHICTYRAGFHLRDRGHGLVRLKCAVCRAELSAHRYGLSQCKVALRIVPLKRIASRYKAVLAVHQGLVRFKLNIIWQYIVRTQGYNLSHAVVVYHVP